jgi:hypothetical protein
MKPRHRLRATEINTQIFAVADVYPLNSGGFRKAAVDIDLALTQGT